MVSSRPQQYNSGQEVGRTLLQARESRGVSVEEAAARLSISPKYIRALEEGDFSIFAAEVYARGACMKYAEFLQLDANQFNRAVARATASGRQQIPLRIYTPQTLLERLVNPRVIFVSGLGIIALAVAAYIAWQVQSFWQLPELSLIEPVDPIVQEDTIMVRGSSERQARVRVNEEPVLLRQDATFEIPLYLHPGVNVVRVEAQNAAGRMRIIERHILLPR